jgi:SynChlorMet cassette protein ScmC
MKWGDSKEEWSWRLQLANDRKWTFVATVPLRPWLNAFAETLRLQQANPTDEGPRLVFRRKRDLPAPSGTTYALGNVTLQREGLNPDWFCTFNGRRGKKRDINFMRQSLMAVYLDAVDGGGFPCHGGLLTWRGRRGIIIAGDSGTGKSTICRRLLPTGTVLCDEETLVVRDGRGRYWGHPFPTWSRLFENPETQSWAVQKAVPLDGIFFVFPAGKNRCILVRSGEAAARLTRMALDKSLRGWTCLKGKALIELREQIFANVCSLVSEVPAARLHVSLAGDMEQEFEKACQRLWEKTC